MQPFLDVLVIAFCTIAILISAYVRFAVSRKKRGPLAVSALEYWSQRVVIRIILATMLFCLVIITMGAVLEPSIVMIAYAVLVSILLCLTLSHAGYVTRYTVLRKSRSQDYA